MPVADEVAAVRASVGVSRPTHIAYVRLTGNGVREFVDRVVTSALRIRDGQLLHTLILSDDGVPFADAYLGCDGEDFFLLAEGPTAAELVTRLEHLRPVGAGIEIIDCSATHTIVGLDGPFAWELLAAVLDPEAIGLPYLTFYHMEDWTCYRAGKTGEFGYGIIVPNADAAGLEAAVAKEGAMFDARDVALAALDQCALENWFFNIRREGRSGATPLELQLQWRLGSKKEFIGGGALRSLKGAGIRRRLTTLVSSSSVAVGDAVSLDGAPAGSVVNAGYCDPRQEWIALALLDVACAYPGVRFTAPTSAEVRSISPPVLFNRSLSVSPQLHSYLTREEHPAPPLVRR